MAQRRLVSEIIRGRIPEFNILVAIVVLSLVIGYINPGFWAIDNWFTILRWFVGLGLLALGQCMVLIAGGIDLSVGSVASLSSMIFAYLVEVMGLDVPLAIMLVIAIGVLIGLYHTLIIISVSPPMPTIVPAFIATLASLIFMRGFAVVMTSGWPIVISRSTGEVAVISTTGSLFAIIAAAFLLVTFMQRYTAIGRFIYAVGGNMEAARVSGVPIHRARAVAYIFSSVFASIAGIVFTSMLMTGYPGVGSGQELYAIASNAIGGVSLAGGEGSALGALLGALLMSVIRNGLVLAGVSPYWHEPVAGIILLVAVILDLLRRARGAR